MKSRKNLPKSGFWGLIGLAVVVIIFCISTAIYSNYGSGIEVYTATFFMLFNVLVSII